MSLLILGNIAIKKSSTLGRQDSQLVELSMWRWCLNPFWKALMTIAH
jgi:hypothetical protein